MGVQSSSNRDSINFGEEVNFDHFQILRAIGKGSFGKVCIVQKKDTNQMYAMKYMHKSQCMERDAMKNVLREMEILMTLEHPFLVNLWFCFQDEEDLFMVSDLLLGGDLRYHISQDIKFTEETIHLYAFELGLALDYLKTKHIIHRDIKPDNILLDEEGHAHITDFNIATVLEENQLATSMSGTKPYIAPEIFFVGIDDCLGYSYAVDWWSLGVTLFEILARGRPFDIHSSTSMKEVKAILHSPVHYSSGWSESTKHLISQLLCIEPNRRLSNAVDLMKHECLLKFNMDTVMEKQFRPGFTPPRDHLNCDPTFELEEMIVEARPLHKKKKRLAKQRSLKQSSSFDIQENDLEEQLADFKVYNRERELIRKALEKKENDWEAELIQAMNESTVVSCEVKPPTLARENSTDSPSASSSLLNLPPSILLDQRRRSSCKLSVSPLSVQTRLAASPQRNKERPIDQIVSSNPKKKVLNRQQTLQRLPYINVDEIITVDNQLIEKSDRLAAKFKEKLRDSIEEENSRSETCDDGQSEMSLANVLIEIEKLKNRGDDEPSSNCDKMSDNEDDVREIEVPSIEIENLDKSLPREELQEYSSKYIDTKNDSKQNVQEVPSGIASEEAILSEHKDKIVDNAGSIDDEGYNYELTRFKVTKSTTNIRKEKLDSKNTPSQLVNTALVNEPTKEIVPTQSENIPCTYISGLSDDSRQRDVCTQEKNIVNELHINVNQTGVSNSSADRKTPDRVENKKADIANNEYISGLSKETPPTVSEKTDTPKSTDVVQRIILTLPNISVSESQSDTNTTVEAPKSPLRSPMDRSPCRSPNRSPKLGDIPTRSVLKNSLYRTDSTDSTKSLEKSPKKAYKVSFSCDVEDNTVRPKSPNKNHGNSKSLDNESEEKVSKKDKKKK